MRRRCSDEAHNTHSRSHSVLTPAQRRLVRSKLPAKPPIGSAGALCSICGLYGHSGSVCSESCDALPLSHEEEAQLLADAASIAPKLDESVDAHEEKEREAIGDAAINDTTAAAAAELSPEDERDEASADLAAPDAPMQSSWDHETPVELTRQEDVQDTQMHMQSAIEMEQTHSCNAQKQEYEHSRPRSVPAAQFAPPITTEHSKLQLESTIETHAKHGAHYAEKGTMTESHTHADSSGKVVLVDKACATECDGIEAKYQSLLEEMHQLKEELNTANERANEAAFKQASAEASLEKEKQAARDAHIELDSLRAEVRKTKSAVEERDAYALHVKQLEEQYETLKVKGENEQEKLQKMIEELRAEKQRERSSRQRAEEKMEEIEEQYAGEKDSLSVQLREAESRAEEAERERDEVSVQLGNVINERDTALSDCTEAKKKQERAENAEDELRKAWQRFSEAQQDRQQHEELLEHKRVQTNVTQKLQKPSESGKENKNPNTASSEVLKELKHAIHAEQSKSASAANAIKQEEQRSSKAEAEARESILSEAPMHLRRHGIAYRGMLVPFNSNSEKAVSSLSTILEPVYRLFAAIQVTLQECKTVLPLCERVIVFVADGDAGLERSKVTAEVLSKCADKSDALHVVSASKAGTERIFSGVQSIFTFPGSESTIKAFAAECFELLGCSDNAVQNSNVAGLDSVPLRTLSTSSLRTLEMSYLSGEQGAWDACHVLRHAHNLRLLRLRSCDRAVHSRALQYAISSGITNVEMLSFGGADIALYPFINAIRTSSLHFQATGTVNETDMEAVVQLLKNQLSHVQHVTLNCTFTESAARRIVASVDTCFDALETMCGVPVQEDAMDTQVFDLSGSQTSPALGLPGALVLANRMEDTSLHYRLRKLDLSGCALGSKGSMYIARALHSTRQLEDLSLADAGMRQEAIEALTNRGSSNAFEALQRLDLSGNDLGDSAGLLVGSLLCACPRLQSVTISRCGVGNASLKSLVAQVKQSSMESFHLKELRLDRNALGDSGMQVFEQVLPLMQCLELLDIEHNFSITPNGISATCNALLQLVSFVELRLGRTAVRAQGADALTQLLKKSPSLQVLDLEQCQLREKGARALLDGLRSTSSLRRVSLARNGLGDRGAIALSTGLQANCSLEFVDLSSNMIGACGANAIARALSRRIALSPRCGVSLSGNIIDADEMPSRFQ